MGVAWLIHTQNRSAMKEEVPLRVASYEIPSADRPLRISVQIQPNQRDGFERAFQRFSEETGIQVESIIASDLEYKRRLSGWLLEGKDSPDVMFWCSSERLYFFAEKGVILPLTEF